MAVLRQIYPSAPEPADAFKTTWSTDEWTLGAYSFRPVNTLANTAVSLAYPVEQLFFAGEAIEPYFYGCAFMSGQRAAGLILSCMGVASPAACPSKEHSPAEIAKMHTAILDSYVPLRHRRARRRASPEVDEGLHPAFRGADFRRFANSSTRGRFHETVRE